MRWMSSFVVFALLAMEFAGVRGQNVGVGLNSPQARFHVRITPSYALPAFRVDSGSTSAPFLIVTSQGLVGIGTATPASALDVAGDIRFSGALMPGGNAGNSGDILVSQGPGMAPQWQPANALPGDNWGSQVAVTSAPLVGDGTSGNPIRLQSGANVGDLIYWNGTSWTVGTPASMATVCATATANMVQKWTGSNQLCDGIIYDDGTSVGIGTTTPTQTLDVNGGLRVRGLASSSTGVVLASSTGVFSKLDFTGSTTQFLRADGTWAVPPSGGGGGINACGTVAAGYLQKWTSAGDICNSIVYESGNQLGILTTTPAATVDIAGNLRVRRLTSAPSPLTSNDTLVVKVGHGSLVGLAFSGSSSRFLRGDGTWGSISIPPESDPNAWRLNGNALSGSEKLGSTNAQDVVVVTNNTERMRITATGQVGIGTASPTHTLDVNGMTRLRSLPPIGIVTSTTKLLVATSTGVVNAINFSGNASDVLRGDGTWGPVSGGDADWYKVGTTAPPTSINDNIYTQGRVGIGTNTPGATLDVAGHIWQTSTGYSVFVGEQAGANDDLTWNRNVFVGYRAGQSNTTGFWNVAVGNEAMALASGSDNFANVAVGYQALYQAQESGNVAVGVRALYSYKTASGAGHGAQVAVGYDALHYDTSGYGNTAIGYWAMYYNRSGYYNTAVGMFAMERNRTGIRNTAVGHDALQFNVLGDNNTAVGTYAGPSSLDTNLTNTTALGYQARTTASNQVRIGNALVTSIGGYAPWTNLSDARFKNEKEDGRVPGLDFVLRLRPVVYQVDIARLNDFLGIPDSLRDPEAEQLHSTFTHTGFMAQEVLRLLDSLGYKDFDVVDYVPGDDNTPYGLRYALFVVPLVKAIQEQQQQITELKADLAERDRRLARLEQQVQQLQNR